MRAIALLSLIAAVGLLGCGGESDSSTSTSSGSSAPQGKADSASGIKQAERDYYYFGQDAGAQRSAIVGAMRDYFTALGARDFSKACSLLSQSGQRSLAYLTGTQGKDCEAGLGVLTPDAFTTAAASAKAKIKSVRLKNGGAYLFYVFASNVSSAQLAQEDGEWKMAVFAGSVIGPAIGERP